MGITIAATSILAVVCTRYQGLMGRDHLIVQETGSCYVCLGICTINLEVRDQSG